METFANIAPIMRNGAEWFAAIGTEKSKGTKVFALAGRVNNTGLIEVPMGISLREIIEQIGGGIPDGKQLKAVQTGGPSGGCIPQAHMDSPVDYESLTRIGSIMGSGGMIVMDETSCMVDVAKYFMEFCKSESCGKCIPCRAGTQQMHALLEKITAGEAHRRRSRPARRALRPGPQHQPVRPRRQRAQPRPHHPQLLPPRVRIPHLTARAAPPASASAEGDRMTKPAPVRVKTLSIDGREVGAREDQTILEVARENNIFIPTLCHLGGLSDIGACRLCLVEVKGMRRTAPRLRHPHRRRHGGHHPLRAARQATAAAFWSCSSPSATTSAPSASPTATATCSPWRSSSA